jgi:Zn-dependent protease
MALAGPAANFSLVILAGLAIQIGVHAHFFVQPDQIDLPSVVEAAAPGIAEGMAKFLSLLFSLNVLLGTFNLIPVPPLDGFNVVPLLLSENVGRQYLAWADSMRSYSLIGMVLAWVLFNKVFYLIFFSAVHTLYR